VHFPDVWIEGMRMADDKMQASAIFRCNHLIAFLNRQSQWLLDQDMLTLSHRFNRLTRMKPMRRRDVDSLNRGIPAQSMEVRIDWRAELPSESLAWAREWIHPGTERDSWIGYRRADHESAGEAKTCDPKTNWGQGSVAGRFYIHPNQRYAGTFRRFTATC
jgi:hypothetical protein